MLGFELFCILFASIFTGMDVMVPVYFLSPVSTAQVKTFFSRAWKKREGYDAVVECQVH